MQLRVEISIVSVFLLRAPWPEAPPEMIAWRERVRDTDDKILRTHHAIRVRSANTIKNAWLEYFYRPGNRGSMLAKVHFEHLEDCALQTTLDKADTPRGQNT